MLESIQDLLNKLRETEKALDILVQEKYKKGDIVWFKFGNMSMYAQGEIEWAGVWHGSVEICLVNCATGKRRRISYDYLRSDFQ